MTFLKCVLVSGEYDQRIPIANAAGILQQGVDIAGLAPITLQCIVQRLLELRESAIKRHTSDRACVAEHDGHFVPSAQAERGEHAQGVGCDLVRLLTGNAGAGHLLPDIEQKPGSRGGWAFPLHHHWAADTSTGLPVNPFRLVSGLVDADVHDIVGAETFVRCMCSLKSAKCFTDGRQTQRGSESLDLAADRIFGTNCADHGTGTA